MDVAVDSTDREDTMRTPIRLVLALAILALAVPAAAQSDPNPPAGTRAFRHGGGAEGPRFGHHGMHPPGRPVITMMLRHRDNLALTPEQVARLEQLRVDFARDAIRRGADLRIAELDLMLLQRADPADLAQIETKLREIERLRTDFRLARIRTVEAAKAQLTPEQKTKLRGLLASDPGQFGGRHRRGHDGPGARSL
jgi:Spy/CpxP family protein refolding chaperone